jgi:hypothetical protein
MSVRACVAGLTLCAQYTIAVSINGTSVASSVVNVLAMDTSAHYDASQSYVTGSGLVRAEVGVPATFTVQARAVAGCCVRVR